MKIGIVGLGKMGANMALRLARGNVEVVGFDPDAGARATLMANAGCTAADDLEALIHALPAPRVVWLMVPAGEQTEETIAALAPRLAAEDVIADVAPVVADSGEGRWTALEAIEQGVPAPVMSLALMMRFASQGNGEYSDKLLAMMRKSFGGHRISPASKS